jgi:hypothetical protein
MVQGDEGTPAVHCTACTVMIWREVEKQNLRIGSCALKNFLTADSDFLTSQFSHHLTQKLSSGDDDLGAFVQVVLSFDNGSETMPRHSPLLLMQQDTRNPEPKTEKRSCDRDTQTPEVFLENTQHSGGRHF